MNTQLHSGSPSSGNHQGGMNHGGHGWMMMICCIPMVIVAVALVVTGVASASALLWAGACVAMMYFMMRGMDHA